jgi:prepilin-type N-terminal cleavage/methylation domain-containing protein
MQKKSKNKHKAFTLLELLIVMIILALLAGLGLMAFGTIQMKARDSRRKQDLVGISKALDTYYNDYGVYPDTDGSGNILGCGTNGIEPCSWGDVWEDDNNTLYMTALPQDPSESQNYYYHRIDEDSYYLFARLENELDKEAAVDASDDPTSYTGYFCDNGGTIGCNYVIMSTNLADKPAVN